MARVLDASAVINSSSVDTGKDTYTTPSVLEELKGLEARSLGEVAKARDELKIISPKEECLKKVKEKAKEVGSFNHLSNTDLEVAALALEKEAEVITDDYTLQNLAAHLDLDYSGVVRGEIKKKRSFKQS